VKAKRQSRPAPQLPVPKLDRRELAVLAAILVATAIVYLPSLRNGWVFDDALQIVNPSPLHSWSGIGKSFIHDSWWFRNPTHLPQSSYYRPLQAAWFALNYMIFGIHPVAWHLEKIVLALIGVTLSFRLAQLLTGSSMIALLTAALFALIPANVESVVWASAIGEPLATMLEIGALCCLIQREPRTGWSRGWLFALTLYACALLAHEIAILFPIVVAAYVFLIECGEDRQLKRSKRNTATIRSRAFAAARIATPFVVVAIAYLCLRIAVLGLPSSFGAPVPAHVGAAVIAQHATPQHGPLDFLLTLPVVLITDVGAMAVPGIAGPAHDVNWITHASAVAFESAGLLAILTAFAWALIRRSSSSDRRLLLFCAAWSALALAPALKLNSIWAMVQDRYLYAPSFGWSVAFAIGAVRLASVSPRARAGIATAMALLFAGYVVTAVRIEPYWHDDVTYFAECAAVDPTRHDYRNKLIDAMEQAGDFNGAAHELERAAASDPDNAYLHLRLTQVYMRLARRQDFEREYQKFEDLRNPAPSLAHAADVH
jgi:hypothetical protein